MQQWYSLNASFNLSTETTKWIRNDSGFNLERLLDLLNNIIFIQAFDSYNPTIKYNPDNKIISFFLG
ncbi:hypothetical protein [Priestia megaterium]|uniref:hypothetical protein n=1 Tax=Priestia megaterium TaxID=1404 RepID=UPI0011A9500D|nr:hypothetical protein [Priestia megaterium]